MNMAMKDALKAKVAQYMDGKGVDAPEEFLNPEPVGMDAEGGEESGMTVEEQVVMLKQAPGFDVIRVIKMLLDDDAVETPEEEIEVTDVLEE